MWNIILLINCNISNQNNSSSDNLLAIQRKKSFTKLFEKIHKNKIINNIKANSDNEEKIINLLIKFIKNVKELEIIDKILLSIINIKLEGKNDIYNHLLDCLSYTNT